MQSCDRLDVVGVEYTVFRLRIHRSIEIRLIGNNKDFKFSLFSYHSCLACFFAFWQYKALKYTIMAVLTFKVLFKFDITHNWPIKCKLRCLSKS